MLGLLGPNGAGKSTTAALKRTLLAGMMATVILFQGLFAVSLPLVQDFGSMFFYQRRKIFRDLRWLVRYPAHIALPGGWALLDHTQVEAMHYTGDVTTLDKAPGNLTR